MFLGRDGRDPERSKDSRRPLPYWTEELGAPRTGVRGHPRGSGGGPLTLVPCSMRIL